MRQPAADEDDRSAGECDAEHRRGSRPLAEREADDGRDGGDNAHPADGERVVEEAHACGPDGAGRRAPGDVRAARDAAHQGKEEDQRDEPDKL